MAEQVRHLRLMNRDVCVCAIATLCSFAVHCSELPFVSGQKNSLIRDSQRLSVCSQNTGNLVCPVSSLREECVAMHLHSNQSNLRRRSLLLNDTPPPRKMLLHVSLCFCILSKLGKSHRTLPQLFFPGGQWGFNVLHNSCCSRLHETTSYFLTKAIFKRKRCFKLMCHLEF